MALLQIENLSRNFDGVKAVDDLSLSVEKGSVTALIGPNGAGKTTLFNLITGFMRPTSGNVTFDGKEITRLSPHRIVSQGIGRTFQTVRLFPKMTVLDNLMLPLSGTGEEGLFAALTGSAAMRRKEETNREKAAKLLESVGLAHKGNDDAETLSFGQRRLVEILRTLALEPRLCLFDEPVSGVFPEMIPTILKVIQEQKAHGRTVFFIEHNMETVREAADRVIVLHHGRKLAEGTPAEIFNHAGVHEAYFGRRRNAP
ncbi:MAG: branched-chain amino acid transport system ATP-binding [Geobacteraceae bacterium]|nr:MAG: branched-chain amino acid transport system ATP-binding [Geobacteraceae bacterium]